MDPTAAPGPSSRSRDRSQGHREIETPVGVLAARAAEVSVTLVSDNEAVATVVQGAADLSTPFSSCQLRAGTRSHGYRGKPCCIPVAAEVASVTGWSHPLLAP